VAVRRFAVAHVCWSRIGSSRLCAGKAAAAAAVAQLQQPKSTCVRTTTLLHDGLENCSSSRVCPPLQQVLPPHRGSRQRVSQGVRPATVWAA
jgi:hypothetical protein